jgi:hypothetical protein
MRRRTSSLQAGKHRQNPLLPQKNFSYKSKNRKPNERRYIYTSKAGNQLTHWAEKGFGRPSNQVIGQLIQILLGKPSQDKPEKKSKNSQAQQRLEDKPNQNLDGLHEITTK